MLPEGVDIEHCCGYISLIKLNTVNDNEDGGKPFNGQMNEESASLLQEEIDNIDNNKPTLELNSDSGQWMLLDVHFGVPLFDSDLNRAIGQRIVTNSLWKSESLNHLEKSGKELCQMLNDFICRHQDLPLNDNKACKIWTTPEERRKSPVPFPSRALFWTGSKMMDKDLCL